MGLDQHAHLRGHKVNWEKYYSDTEASIYEQKQVFVWRKHARLQEFMAKKWADQNPSVKVEGHLAHLGFNSDQDAPCYMTQEVVDELGEQIEKGFFLPPSLFLSSLLLGRLGRSTYRSGFGRSAFLLKSRRP